MIEERFCRASSANTTPYLPDPGIIPNYLPCAELRHATILHGCLRVLRKTGTADCKSPIHARTDHSVHRGTDHLASTDPQGVTRPEHWAALPLIRPRESELDDVTGIFPFTLRIYNAKF
jgi:hypothetical protein